MNGWLTIVLGTLIFGLFFFWLISLKSNKNVYSLEKPSLILAVGSVYLALGGALGWLISISVFPLMFEYETKLKATYNILPFQMNGQTYLGTRYNGQKTYGFFVKESGQIPQYSKFGNIGTNVNLGTENKIYKYTKIRPKTTTGKLFASAHTLTYHLEIVVVSDNFLTIQREHND